MIAFFIVSKSSDFYSYYTKDFQEEKEERPSLKESMAVVKKIWTSLAIMGALIVAYNASPTALVVSEGEGTGVWNDVYFIPTITYLMGAVCELIGRAVSFKYTFVYSLICVPRKSTSLTM